MGKISSGNEVLDELLEGGFEQDAITTIYGPPGSGKTNFGIMAALHVAKSKKVIFVDTEGGFSVDRVRQILPEYEALLDNIIFLKPTTFEDQIKVISQLRELATERIGLIVIDTVSMLYRLQRGEDSYHEHKELSTQMRILNEIARTRRIPVLLISQIYQGFDGSIKIVGGDIINYTSKCLLEMKPLVNGRIIRLKKHRSLPARESRFKIVEKGVEPIRQ